MSDIQWWIRFYKNCRESALRTLEAQGSDKAWFESERIAWFDRKIEALEAKLERQAVRS